jgi:hypothetical protein
MTINDLLFGVQSSGLAHLISKSDHLVGATLQIVHVLGFVLLLAALVLTSLRLLGRVFPAVAVPQVALDAAPLFAIGLTLTLTSGALMFIASPLLYYYKWAFQLKMLLLALAVGAHLLLFRRVSARAEPGVVTARLSVALSLVLWFGIALAGRMIGFT